MERCFPCVGISRKYHTDDPEENNIISGHQNVRRIEILHLLRLFRPSQCRKRPQRRTKPCIQRILILGKMGAATVRADLWHFSCYYKFSAFVTIICRNPVSPPNLSGNTPVTDILQPVQIYLVKTFRNKLKLPGLNRIDCRFRQLFHLHKPLLLNQRLHRSLATVMGSHIVYMVFNPNQITLLFQIRHNRLSCLIAVHTCILATQFINGSIIIHNIDFRQIVTLSDFKVIRVMSRCNLNGSGSKFLIHIAVRNNRNLLIYQRKQHHLPHYVPVSLIIRVYGNRCIPKHGFRTGGRNLKKLIRSYNRIPDMPEMPCLLLMLHLCVRKTGLTYRTPVDNAWSLVNIPFFVQFYKYFFYRFRAALIHGEAFSVPVTGRSQLL